MTTNCDYSAHCVKVASKSHLFSWRKREHKFWWVSGIRRRKTERKKKGAFLLTTRGSESEKQTQLQENMHYCIATSTQVRNLITVTLTNECIGILRGISAAAGGFESPSSFTFIILESLTRLHSHRNQTI